MSVLIVPFVPSVPSVPFVPPSLLVSFPFAFAFAMQAFAKLSVGIHVVQRALMPVVQRVFMPISTS